MGTPRRFAYLRRAGSSARRGGLLLTCAVLALGCDQLLKSPDAKYATVDFEEYLKSSDVLRGARFGQNIAFDDDSLIAAAPYEAVDLVDGDAVESDEGTIYVFSMTTKTPLDQPVRLTRPHATSGDATFPASLLPEGTAINDSQVAATVVSLDPDWIALGLPGEDSALAPVDGTSMEEAEANNDAPDAGAVFLYRRSNLAEPPRYIKAPNPKAGDMFGVSIGLSGGWLAVAAVIDASSNPDDPADEGAPQSGAVYMYRYESERDEFVFQQYVKAPSIHEGDLFGSALSIEGDLMAVGALLEDGGGAGFGADYDDTSLRNAGAVYTYRWNGEKWAFDAYLKAAAPDPDSAFGAAVQVMDGRIAVGAPFGYRCPGDEPVPFLGVAYVISQQDGEWADFQCLSPKGRSSGGWYGFALSGHGKRLVVGSPWDPYPDRVGKAYVFELDDAEMWHELTAITASNRESGDAFGAAVGVNSTTVAIGAFGESGADSGPHADLANNDAPEAGAVYLFSMP